MKVLLLLSLILVTARTHTAEDVKEANEGEKLDVRHPSMFKIGDDWLALPEVYSNLDFAADNTHAADDDVEGQLRLRSTRYWGRLYIEGWPQTIQFFRAHFGSEPPMGRKRFVFAEPRDGCEPLTNANIITNEHIVLVNRGTCTFGTKAKEVMKTNASSVIIVNNEPGLDHLPGPDAHDIDFSVSSIAQTEGQLLEAVYDEGPPEDGFGRKLMGSMVPINCGNQGSGCKPSTVEERNYANSMIDGGIVTVTPGGGKMSSLADQDIPIEYLMAHFGTKVPNLNVSLPIVMAKPAEACDPITNDVKGKIVLVRRGSCPFVKKSEAIQSAGGSVMAVGSLHPYILRMGVEPRWKGLNTAIPVLMVSKRAYAILLAESFLGGTAQFEESANVTGAQWEGLEKLGNGQGWPRSSAYVAKKYAELKAEHAAWPDRLACIEDGYKMVSAKLSPDKSDL